MNEQTEDQALDAVVRMVKTSEPGSNAFLVIGAFSSKTWYLDAIVEAALIHLGDRGDVSVNRTRAACYAPGGRTFRVISADAPSGSLAGFQRKSLHFAPCARDRMSGRSLDAMRRRFG